MVTKPQLIVVDENDKTLGFAGLEESHLGRGKHHRAFVTILLDSKERVILQRRKHRLFNGFWDLTAISHPLKIGKKVESYQQASDRALKKEMGIGHVKVKKIEAFNYFAKDGKNCENEYCAILTGEYSGKISPNKEEVYEYKRVKFDDFLLNIKKNPEKYTPWAKLAAEKYSNEDFSLLNEELKKFIGEFSKYQQQFFIRRVNSSGKYSSLISNFYKDLADFSSGGKKLRPFLVYLGWIIAGKKDLPKILPIALAFELVHSFLLIHDDVIDRSDTRRGKPTLHNKFEKKFGSHYGISQAIILGDIACFEAFKLIAESDFTDQIKIKLISNFSVVLLETGYGEGLDVEYTYKKASLKEIFSVTNLKTARYSFFGPLILGAIAGGAEKSLISKLEKFALPLGSAFQLTDDILGTFGEEKTMGKSPISDLVEGKNTLLVYKAKELANTSDRKVLTTLWGKGLAKIPDLKKVREIIEKSGALAWAKTESMKETDKAKNFVNSISSDHKLQEVLDQLADFVVRRKN